MRRKGGSKNQKMKTNCHYAIGIGHQQLGRIGHLLPHTRTVVRVTS
jgi:hypothetical protein